MTFNFEAARKDLFKDGYTQKQVDSINAIIEECNKQGVKLKTQVAYILATAYHECYNPKTPETRLTPMKEFGGETYLKSKKYYPFYGRGFSQLTWKENYQKESKRLGIDLISNPDKMLEIPISANSHVYCMMNGRYTGVGIPKYINETKTDYLNARRIVNGIDKNQTIANYAEKFAKLLLP